MADAPGFDEPRSDAPDPNRRWVAALEMANGVVDEKRVRHSRRKVIAWLVVLLVVLFLLGFAAAFVLPPYPGEGSEAGSADSPRLITALFVEGLGIVIGVVGFIWAKKTGRYVTRWRSVASPLSRTEKISARKQINGKLPIDTEKLPVLVAIARQNQRVSLGAAPTYTALLLIALAQAILTDVALIRYIELAVVILLLVALVQLGAAYRRAGQFVALHADPAA